MSSISTNGWDTVFATTYATLNSQISAQWATLIENSTSLANMTCTMQRPNGTPISLTLNMAAWQLTQGGSGNLVHLILPITSGTFTGFDGTYDLSGQNMIIQVSLQWIPQPDQIQFAINSNVCAIEADLNGNPTTIGSVPVTSKIIEAFASYKVTLSSSSTMTVVTKGYVWKITDPSLNRSFYIYLTNTAGADLLLNVYQYVVNSLKVNSTSAATPTTVISAGTISDPYDGPLLQELVSKNIDENIREFEFVFAAVDVVTHLPTTDSWAWLQPTSNEYAVIEPLNSPTNDNCTFAILSMVNNNVNQNPVLQVDANAIAPNCTSSLLISPALFLHQMMLPNVAIIFNGSSQSDFEVDESNLSIVNTTTLTWAHVALTSSQDVAVTIKEKEFSMSLENDLITIAFSNLSYPITMFGQTVGHTDVVYTAQFQLGLKKGENGNQTLWFDYPQDQPPVNDVTAVMDSTYYEIEEIIGGITIGLSFLSIGGAVRATIARGAARAAARTSGAVAANVGAAEIDEVMQGYLNNPETRQAFMDQAGQDAADTLDGGLVNARKANLWSAGAKYMGRLAAATGGVDGGMEIIQSVLESSAQNNWENTPAFRNFADKCVSGFSFGGLKDFNVEFASLAGSLQIGFT